ncbi:MAG: hypothetical protein HY829_10670 [Actinobacteria bacterium]|nr:hypothetical protein [Actinomycetota bacterium]
MRALLIAMRSRIARAVQNPKTSPRDLAALTRQLQDIAKQIEEIDLLAKAQEDESDDEVPDEDFDPSAL